MTEAQLQQTVLDFARSQGWLAYHTYSSRRSAPGFPDAILVRGRRLLAIEFKSEKGRLSAEQRTWLQALAEVSLVEPLVVRPGRSMEAITELLR